MIDIKNLSKIYNLNQNNQVVALDNVSLTVEDGQMLAVSGPSGSGKSTLLNVLAGNLKYDSGEYFYNDKNIARLNNKELAIFRNREIGMVFQNNLLLENNTVFENVELPLLFAKGINKAKRKELCEKALEKASMLEYEGREVKKLSGGQKQRVAIARAIVNLPNTILADEPTGSLDSKMKQDIMSLFKKINENGTTVIIVSHDDFVIDCCGSSVSIKDGKLSQIIKN